MSFLKGGFGSLSLKLSMLVLPYLDQFALLFTLEVQRRVVLSMGAVSPKAKQMQVLSKHLFFKYVSSVTQTEKKQITRVR